MFVVNEKDFEYRFGDSGPKYLTEKAGWRVNPYWITSLHAVKTKLMPLKPIMQVSKRLLSWKPPKIRYEYFLILDSPHFLSFS